jgi:hypothetical protein
MDELDTKLSALRNATEKLSPRAPAISRIHQAVDQLALGKVAIRAGLGTKPIWLLSGIVLGAAGGILFTRMYARPPERAPVQEQVVTAAPPPPAAPVRVECDPPVAPVPAAAPAVLPARRTASACKGRLVTTSTPSAEVLVDGKTTGRWTPILRTAPIELEAMEHLVAYRPAGGEAITRLVSIECDQETDVLDVVAAVRPNAVEPAPNGAPEDGKEVVPQNDQGDEAPILSARRLREWQRDRAAQPESPSPESRTVSEKSIVESEKPQRLSGTQTGVPRSAGQHTVSVSREMSNSNHNH